MPTSARMNLSWKNRQLSKARKIFQAQPKPRQQKVTRSQVIRAIEDSGGIKKDIAGKLKISRPYLDKLLNLPGWEVVKKVYLEEVSTVTDDAENTIRKAINAHYDLPTASANARWYLSKIKKDTYGDETTTVIEGGKSPLKTINVNVPIEALDLPVETQRQILEALDKREQEQHTKLIQNVIVKDSKNEK